MIRINLLPHREEKRKARRQQFYALVGLVFAVGITIWFFGYLVISGYISSQESTNGFLRAEITVLDNQISEIKKLRADTETLLARKQVIESLQSHRAETVYLFNELAKRIPAGVYLRSIKQTGLTVALTGYAQSSTHVSALMRSLDDSPLLERPTLIEIKAATVGKRRLADFNMNIFITRQTTDNPAKPEATAASSNTGNKP